MKTWHYSCLHPRLSSAACSGEGVQLVGLQPCWGGPARGRPQPSRGRPPVQQLLVGALFPEDDQGCILPGKCSASRLQSVCQEGTGPIAEPKDSFPHICTSCHLALSNLCRQRNWLIVTKNMYFCIQLSLSSIRKNVSNGTRTPE